AGRELPGPADKESRLNFDMSSMFRSVQFGRIALDAGEMVFSSGADVTFQENFDEGVGAELPSWSCVRPSRNGVGTPDANIKRPFLFPVACSPEPFGLRIPVSLWLLLSAASFARSEPSCTCSRMVLDCGNNNHGDWRGAGAHRPSGW